LLETRLLVQANSGGGKSWALRRILEQTATKVQQLVIDPEGEFATLREKFDYVICAPHDADAIATPRTAFYSLAGCQKPAGAILDIMTQATSGRLRREVPTTWSTRRSAMAPSPDRADKAHDTRQRKAAPSTGASRRRDRGRKWAEPCVATQRLAKLHRTLPPRCCLSSSAAPG
jgi:hypothetical protein